MPWKDLNIMNQKTEFVLKAQQTENFRALCREYGISPKTGYKWMQRMLTHGLEGLNDESRRPRTSPEALAEEVVCRIVRLKERHRTWGPRKIRELYERQWGGTPSESSFKRVLERAGMTEKKRVRKAGQSGRITSKPKAEAPNDVWTVDLKGWWNDPQGRCEPLTVRDEFSRFVLEARSLPNARTEHVRNCFESLFERHGLPSVIRSDNGTPFASVQGLLGLTKLSAWWIALGIDLERGRPGCPQDNGAHERMHRDLGRANFFL
jgi:transposase InsO family protein